MSQPGDHLRSEERFRLLFEDAPVAYHELDREARISRVNRAECAMLGYEATELLGRHIWELVVPEESEECRRSVTRKLAGAEQPAPIQRRLQRKDGRPVTVEIYQSTIEDASGKVAGLRGVLINVTERQQAMEAMLASE